MKLGFGFLKIRGKGDGFFSLIKLQSPIFNSEFKCFCDNCNFLWL